MILEKQLLLGGTERLENPFQTTSLMFYSEEEFSEIGKPSRTSMFGLLFEKTSSAKLSMKE